MERKEETNERRDAKKMKMRKRAPEVEEAARDNMKKRRVDQ